MHGSFLSSSLKAQLQTPLRVRIGVMEDECREEFILILELFFLFHKDTARLFCSENEDYVAHL